MLVDCITGLPIFELTTTADVSDSTVVLDILSRTNKFLPLKKCFFLADKAYDVKAIYNQIHSVYQGECFIPINPRNTKNPKLLPSGNPVCEAGLAMNKDGKDHSRNRTRQNSVVLLSFPKAIPPVPATVPPFSTERSIADAQNTLRFQMITGFQLIVTVFPFNPSMPCVRNVSATTPDLNSPGRNVFGFTTKAVPKI